MGTLIKMVSAVRPRFRINSGNSIRLSIRAARQCLKDAGIDSRDLGLIINSGIYRHKNTGEPAIAALIQEKISPDKTAFNSSADAQKTFSFDINNGGCGFLTGIEIISGSINNDEMHYGMVVTGDTEPFHGLSENYNFYPAAAAIVLSGSDDLKGFSNFRTYSYPEYSEELVCQTSYSNTGWMRRGRNILKIMQKDSYPDICADCAEKSLSAFLSESGITLSDVDLIIPSQSPVGFMKKLKSRLGNFQNLIETSESGNKVFHTAGVAFALKKVWDDNRFGNSKRTIFLTLGSGIKVSLALYNN